MLSHTEIVSGINAKTPPRLVVLSFFFSLIVRLKCPEVGKRLNGNVSITEGKECGGGGSATVQFCLLLISHTDVGRYKHVITCNNLCYVHTL